MFLKCVVMKSKDYKINLREQFKGNTVNDIYTVEL